MAKEPPSNVSKMPDESSVPELPELPSFLKDENKYTSVDNKKADESVSECPLSNILDGEKPPKEKNKDCHIGGISIKKPKPNGGTFQFEAVPWEESDLLLGYNYDFAFISSSNEKKPSEIIGKVESPSLCLEKHSVANARSYLQFPKMYLTNKYNPFKIDTVAYDTNFYNLVKNGNKIKSKNYYVSSQSCNEIVRVFAKAYPDYKIKKLHFKLDLGKISIVDSSEDNWNVSKNKKKSRTIRDKHKEAALILEVNIFENKKTWINKSFKLDVNQVLDFIYPQRKLSNVTSRKSDINETKEKLGSFWSNTMRQISNFYTLFMLAKVIVTFVSGDWSSIYPFVKRKGLIPKSLRKSLDKLIDKDEDNLSKHYKRLGKQKKSGSTDINILLPSLGVEVDNTGWYDDGKDVEFYSSFKLGFTDFGISLEFSILDALLKKMPVGMAILYFRDLLKENIDFNIKFKTDLKISYQAVRTIPNRESEVEWGGNFKVLWELELGAYVEGKINIEMWVITANGSFTADAKIKTSIYFEVKPSEHTDDDPKNIIHWNGLVFIALFKITVGVSITQKRKKSPRALDQANKNLIEVEGKKHYTEDQLQKDKKKEEGKPPELKKFEYWIIKDRLLYPTKK